MMTKEELIAFEDEVAARFNSWLKQTYNFTPQFP